MRLPLSILACLLLVPQDVRAGEAFAVAIGATEPATPGESCATTKYPRVGVVVSTPSGASIGVSYLYLGKGDGDWRPASPPSLRKERIGFDRYAVTAQVPDCRQCAGQPVCADAVVRVASK